MVEAERKAVREKTARLRAQRLNGDAETATKSKRGGNDRKDVSP
jgi:hypothetical protein